MIDQLVTEWLQSRRLLPLHSLGNINLMHFSHMIDHLILPREAVLALPMTVGHLTIYPLDLIRMVYDGDVALQVSVPGEGGGALGVEADVLVSRSDMEVRLEVRLEVSYGVIGAGDARLLLVLRCLGLGLVLGVLLLVELWGVLLCVLLGVSLRILLEVVC